MQSHPEKDRGFSPLETTSPVGSPESIVSIQLNGAPSLQDLPYDASASLQRLEQAGHVRQSPMNQHVSEPFRDARFWPTSPSDVSPGQEEIAAYKARISRAVAEKF